MVDSLKKEELKKVFIETLEPFANAIKEDFDRIDERFDKVDERLNKVDERFDKVEGEISVIKINLQEGFRETKEKLLKLEARINDTYNAVDGFIKIVTRLEDEFAALKMDLKRVKEVIREKLGVDLF